MFVTPYNFCDFEEEKKLVDETCIVETAGYQPKERLIQQLNHQTLQVLPPVIADQH